MDIPQKNLTYVTEYNLRIKKCCFKTCTELCHMQQLFTRGVYHWGHSFAKQHIDDRK